MQDALPARALITRGPPVPRGEAHRHGTATHSVQNRTATNAIMWRTACQLVRMGLLIHPRAKLVEFPIP